MAYPALRLEVRFRRQDIESAINLKRVGINDLGIATLRELKCQRRFPDGGGTNQKKRVPHQEIVGQPSWLPKPSQRGHARALVLQSKSGDGRGAASPD